MLIWRGIARIKLVNVTFKDSIIEFKANTIGNFNLQLYASDSYDASDLVMIELSVFENMAPVAEYDVTQIVGGFSPTEIEIDATASFDQDEEFGGSVIEYEYKINNNYSVEPTSLSKIRYITEQPGQIKVQVRVKDDEGLWSEWAQQFFTVE